MKPALRIKLSLFYLGLIPFFPFLLFSQNENDEIQKQYHKALVVSFIQIITIVISLLLWAFGYYAVAELSPQSLEEFTLYHIFIPGYFLALLILFGFFLWLFYFITNLFNLKWNLKFIKKLSTKKTLLKVSYTLNSILFLFFCIILFWIADANRMSQKVIKPAKVYMLYDDMGFVPHWVFPFGFYQILKTANNKWDKGAVSIEPITNKSLNEAILNGKMVFLSVHGGYSTSEFAGLFHFMNNARNKYYAYGPEEIAKLGIGNNLEFIYLAQCNGGSKHEEWVRVFYPAKVKTFDRISTYPEHIFWLWYKLPKILNNIP